MKPTAADQHNAGRRVDSYSVWAIPPDDVSNRIKKVMLGLRDEFGGGPEIVPHIPMVGSICMTQEDALNKFWTVSQSYPDNVSAFVARVEDVVTRPFYYQCVCLCIHNSLEINYLSGSYCEHYGFRLPVLPYVSLLYANLTEEERKKAQEKVSVLDETITSLSFPVTRLALYKVNYSDKTLKSWEMIAEYPLQFKYAIKCDVGSMCVSGGEDCPNWLMSWENIACSNYPATHYPGFVPPQTP